LIWYRVKFRMKSWTASAWQADTVFGHLCWGLRYLEGEQKLKDFLHQYETGQPPILVSNGFPCDFLPSPLLPVTSMDASLPLEEQRRLYEEMKVRKKARYLTPEDFSRVINGQKPVLEKIPEAEYQRVTVKNTINRLTGTTGEEGSLYNFTERFTAEITIYLKIAEDFISGAAGLFRYVKDTGYGKRKSIGYGQIEDYSFETFKGFDAPVNQNGFVSLSNFVPSQGDPLKGSWKTLTKYGKMGEEYSLEDHVFKKPLVMLEAGASFYDKPVRSYYGCLVENLNSFYPGTIQYAFALPVPILLPEPARQPG
jgi:CRISPR-associated protein Csm4